MGIFLLIYLVSIILSFFTLPIFVEKNIGLAAGLFLLFTPIINLLWPSYCLIKIIKSDQLNFISDLKKLFGIN